MFCPNCGTKPLEGQRFCKQCGTNLDLVSDALKEGGDSLGQLRIDMESLKKNFDVSKWFEDGSSVKASVHRHQHKEQPRPKEWLTYSRQHNVKNGLISLFSGVGLGVVLHHLGRVAVNEGLLREIDRLADRNIHGLEQLLLWAWLFALIPVLKGIGQIIYGIAFAEPMSVLAERFAPQPPPHHAPQPVTSPINPALSEPPPSVTEHTTNIIGEAARPAGRDTQ